VTKKRDGTVIDGDPSEVVLLTDVRTFRRNTRARDPNWALIATHVPN
jgi:predicted lipid-binding transport protein (Tim44 family)